jgi:HOMODA hydrolase
MIGSEIRYVEAPTFGHIRIAEAGPRDAPTILFQHGIGGHLEAYSKNIVALSDDFHCVAFDYVGHGMSSRKAMVYTPVVLAEQVRELMDALSLQKAHLSGESLGGWVSGFFALKYPERVNRLMINTGAGIPIVSEKGRADMANLMELSKKAGAVAPTFESVKARIRWLIHPRNHHLITDELVNVRLRYYTLAGSREIAPMINGMLPRHDEFLLPLEQIHHRTMFLWTRDNPIHDLECAQAAATRMRDSTLYVMATDSAHWPQYEGADEFNNVARDFFNGREPKRT